MANSKKTDWLSYDALLIESRCIFGWVDIQFGRVEEDCSIESRSTVSLVNIYYWLSQDAIIGRVEVYYLIEFHCWFRSDALLVKSRLIELYYWSSRYALFGQVNIYYLIESRMTIWLSQDTLFGWVNEHYWLS